MSYIIIDSTFLHPTLKTWKNKLSPVPSKSFLRDLNSWFKELGDNNLAEIDFLELAATEYQQNAQVPIISTSVNNITEVNSPTWTANQGYTGNGTSMYLNLNWTPSTNGVKYTLNNASHGVYSRIDSQSTSTEIGTNNAATTNMSQLYCRYTNDKLYIRVNQGSGLSDKNAADSLGLKSAVRNDSTTVETWSKGISLGTNAINSTAASTVSFFALASNNAGSAILFSERQLAMIYMGSANLNQLTLSTSHQNFATRRGYNV